MEPTMYETTASNELTVEILASITSFSVKFFITLPPDEWCSETPSEFYG
jgi:hypothetical protein